MHDYLRVEGTAAIVGLGNREPSVNPVHFFKKQLTMFASNLYPEWMLPEVVEFVRKRKVPLEQIITHTRPARGGAGGLPAGRHRHDREDRLQLGRD